MQAVGVSGGRMVEHACAGAAERRAARPLVSAIIPTHDRARLVGDAIESVLRVKQRVADRLDLEILVVDDWSSDDTAEVVGRYPVRYVQNEGRGVSTARNTGLRLAAGEFVAFLDDDDIWIDDPLAEHVAVLQAHPDAAAVFSQGYLADEHLNPVYGPFPKPPLPQGDAFIWSLGTTLPMGAAVYRRSALEAVGGFDESLTSAEDNDIQLRLTARFDLFGIERSTVLWRQHPHRNVAYTAWRAHFAPFDRMMARNTRLPARVRVSARQRLRAHLQHRGWSAAYAVTQAGQWLADGDLAESGKFLWGAVYASPLHALLRIRAFWTTLARWGYTVAVRRLRRTAFASTTQSR
ncbi:MAG: glycosyltransferase family 2 protein [Chloroflexi bacterium]|nr:glycosyltransferase family 2 protein [Chloroflexota bacterium]